MTTINNRMHQLEDFTREAVPKIFQELLSMELQIDEPSPLADEPGGQIIGSVGFIGEATGIIYLYAPMSFARQITSTMLGLPEDEVPGDEMVADAIGELTNMVVGCVKSRLCDGGAPCTLTIPSVVCGRQLTVEAASNVQRRTVGFRTSHQRLLAQMLLKD